MTTKQKFWKLLAGLLLYNLITHWEDAKNGFLDAWQENSIQNQTNNFPK